MKIDIHKAREAHAELESALDVLYEEQLTVARGQREDISPATYDEVKRMWQRLNAALWPLVKINS